MENQLTKREQIKAVAARMFREKGYRATSMRDIATGVGMKAASLYNHIEHKQEILAELLMHIARLFTKGMEDVQNSSFAPLEKMERLIQLHIRLTVEHPDSISIITSEWVHLEEDTLNVYKELRDTYEQQFKSIIEACVAEGSFAQVDTEIAMFSILSTLRWLYAWYGKQREINPLELEKQMIHCLLDGLKSRG
ncbi:MAG: TetR/AcrR family transcriptional regulator [Bacteroidota bacterium]